ncbi:hypothetical protein DAETH_34260 (plasmid) [Deinococcus aetherius]|uniref:DUF2383 domain-containing protein n=1 Tax=Deinococcus aetherius TaxID=200252 RepID=A0ABN6RJB8_9DEIO|nr:hypothetical protein [Deinococcus aetherius]BDP43457.1 hypothetical protein DAETH_34260 [Deinococcus aetherius]
METQTGHVGTYLGLLQGGEEGLARAFRLVAKQHSGEPDLPRECETFAAWSDDHVTELRPFLERYGGRPQDPGLLHHLFGDAARGMREGSVMLTLLRQLGHLWVMAQDNQASWVVLTQAAQHLRDESLKLSCREALRRNHVQLAWLKMHLKERAPQTLLVPDSTGKTTLFRPRG